MSVSLGAIFFILFSLGFSIGETVVDEKFFNSAREGDTKYIEAYLKANPTLVSARDGRGNNALVIAAGRGKIDVLKVLLKYRANPEDYTNSGLFEGKSALSWAASQGRSEALTLLLQSGANAHLAAVTGVFQGKTALMWASSQGRTEVVRLLLLAGVDVNHSSHLGNFKGKSNLMWASSQGRVDTVAVLLEAGADVNAVDEDGVSALMWASGSEVKKGNGDHQKGLFEKAEKGHIDVIRLLLKYGAQPDMRDRDGITAIMYACFHGHSGAVKAFLNEGANADFRNMAGRYIY
jgi:ankyrin repeat protein